MDKLDINFFVPGMPFDGQTIKDKSLGGSETAGYYMGRELAKRGHRVNMFTNTSEPGHDEFKVQYLPLEMWDQFSKSTVFDVAIAQRAPGIFAPKLSSRLNFLWCHDLAQPAALKEFRGTLWNVDKVLVVSQYMRRQYERTYGIGAEAELFHVTRNGVDLSAFPSAPLPRARKALVYTSRPERGLDVVLDVIFPALLERDPEYTLHLAGYNNPVEHMREFYDYCFRRMHQFGDKVRWHGYLDKASLYRLYSECGAYIYPTPSPMAPDFREVSCITAMEAQAAGLPIVASNAGALIETIHPDAGRIITKGDHGAFIDAVFDLTHDAQKWGEASGAGRKAATRLDWSAVAEEWEDLIFGELTKKSSSPETLASHFIRRSDIIAARAALEGVDTDRADVLRGDIAKNYAFLDGRDVAAYYESFSDSEYNAYTDEQARAFSAERYVPVQELLEIVKPSRVLDYGCAHGHFTNQIARDYPGMQIVGADHDRNALALARRLKEPSASFVHIGEDIGHDYDLALLMEILEHVERPWELAEEVESRVAVGGYVFVTVPFGPWEYATYKTKPRQHVWEFDFHDLLDMFKDKPDLNFRALVVGADEFHGERLGFNVLWYKADHRPVGKINMARKLAIQAPRQTVSANIIAGPDSEQTLEWCLRSLEHVADEIIVVDCGMNDLALLIANRHNARIVEGVDPKIEGFEAPRNIGLSYCACDWVLWIDTDERLVDPTHVQKYLRSNFMQGYSIRQHHFACDTTFTPDMPVRLFRNNGNLRFYGMIHEHPERDLNQGPGETVVVSDAHIAHVGYIAESVRRRRFARNKPGMDKDRKKYPDRLLQKVLVMRDNVLEIQYIFEGNGGRVDDRVRALANETIELWREHFRGKPVFNNSDPLEYYSVACTVLNLGFEINYAIAAGSAPGQPKTVRFANHDDYVTEITAHAARLADNVPSEDEV